MQKLLVIDDEPNLLYSLDKCLRSASLQVHTCCTAREGLREVAEWQPDVVILDVCLPDASGLDVYDQIHELQPDLPVILITAFSRTDTAIEAMKRGAFEYLVKPVDIHRLRREVERAIEIRLLSQVTAIDKEYAPLPGEAADTIVGQSPAIQEVYKSIGRVASQDVTALILGESGTGKELVARAIWRFSNRQHKPFIAINCAAIPEALLESELFGYEKGAFTGATERRIGKFEHANGGTVFLDEVADMTSATQAKVLRLIQEQRFERIGGTQVVQTDVRIIAATNKNLLQMVNEGSFRQDLYYRINGYTILLPSLSERRGDIPLLANHFIQRFNREMGKIVRGMTPEAAHWLERQPWPGNVRELQNTLKYAMIKSVSDILTPDCFPPSQAVADPVAEEPSTDAHDALPGITTLTRKLLQDMPGDVYRRMATAVDQIVLQEALRYTKGNQLHAAALLGISRTTLRAKLRGLGLSVEKQLLSECDGNPCLG